VTAEDVRDSFNGPVLTVAGPLLLEELTENFFHDQRKKVAQAILKLTLVGREKMDRDLTDEKVDALKQQVLSGKKSTGTRRSSESTLAP